MFSSKMDQAGSIGTRLEPHALKDLWMSGNNSPQRRQCPCCGFTLCDDEDPPALFHRRWHVRGPDAVRALVDSLSEETHESLLALYVDQELNLLGVETVARGDV